MKKLNKLALAVALASASSAALAVQVTLEFDGTGAGGAGSKSYSAGEMTIDDNGISISNVVGGVAEDITCDDPTVVFAGGVCTADLDAICGGSENVDTANNQCLASGGVGDPEEVCDPANGVQWNEDEGTCLPDLPPSLVMDVDPDSLEPGETTATVTFTFSEPVEGFTSGDVSVSSGSISGLQMQSTSSTEEVWTAQFNRDGNDTETVTISVAAGSFEDEQDNENTAGASVSLTLVGDEPACDLRFPGYTVHEDTPPYTSWGVGTYQKGLDLTRDGIHAYKIETTSNPAFYGSLSFVPFSNTGNIQKEIWISECPGGQPLTEPFASSCAKTAIQTTLKWQQNDTLTGKCELETNSTYYLNVQNVPGACPISSGCDTKLQHIVTGSPDL